MNATLAEAMLEPAEFDPFAGDAIERVIPTSEAQREVWLADKLSHEASLAFNESGSIRLRGPLDRAALQGALNGLLAAHDALRCTVSPDGTELLVNASAPLALACIDLEAASEMARNAALANAALEAVQNPFNLEQGPLLRAVLFRLSSLEHVLLMTAHHIVCDGWSWGVMIDSLGAFYAEQTGAAPGPEPAPSYADYVAWEAAQAATPEMAEHETFWLGRFAGSSLPVLDLMPDRARAPMRSFKADRVDHNLDSGLVSDLRRLGSKVGASAFATMFSGFAATLQRLTGQDDLVIGVPAAGQSASGMNRLVGHCVNLLPVRTAVAADQPFDAFVQQSSTMLLDAFDHQTLTYGSLLKKLPVRRDPSRLPLVSVMFNVDQAIKKSSETFPGLTVEYANNARRFENFELFVNAAQHDGGMRLECQYNTDLFDARTVQRWMVAYEALLRSAVSDPGVPIGKLGWVAPAEHTTLQSLQPERTELPADALMHTAIARQCAAVPRNVALRHNGEELCYLELDQRSNALARVLRERGIQRGERVGLCLPRGINMVLGLMAVLKAGGTYVPLDPGFPQARLAYYAEDAKLALLLTESTVATAPLTWRNDANTRVIRLDQETAWREASGAPLEASSQDAEPGSTAYIIYTSGSTGKPKGVCLPHRAAANFLASMASKPGMVAEDRLAAVTTLSFDIAVLELLLPLSVGAQVIIVPRDTAMDGNLLRELLVTSGATMMQATPGMWRMLLDTPWKGGAGFKALVGGESLPPDLAYDMLERSGEVWNMYGPTETTVWSTLWRVERQAVAQRGVSIGRPIGNTSVWILNEAMQPCPIGVPGEICIGGEGVAQGYLDRPELTADRFVADPFSRVAGARLYRTGDRGRWRNDGLLEHLGRLDFQVKVRGYRIELGEIEAGCNDFPGVTQSVVLAREDNPGDVRLVAYLTMNQGVGADDVSLRAHLRGRLPDYMLPQHVVVLPSIPLLPNGKVDRKALPPPTISHVATAERVAPRNDLERAVAAAMQGVLKLPDIGIHDDFFALGGHSLLAARLIGLVNRDLDVQLSLRTLFESPTVEQLAVSVEKYRGAPTAARREPVKRREAQDRAPLSLMQERMRFIEEMYPGRVDYNTPSAHRLKGPMDLNAFDSAFAEMIKRQPSLRTRIAATPGGFVQQVEDALPFSLLPLEDLSALPKAQQELAVDARTTALMAETFTLDRAPLFKAHLIKLAEDEHVFFFMPHHIIWDGWSFDLLYSELAAHYEACLGKRKSDLPLPTVSYGDFAQWHQRWMASEEIRLQKEYWKDQFARGGMSREPFADRQRVPEAPSVGGIAQFRLQPAEVEPIRELAKKTGTTLSIVAMSAFTVLMSQWLADQRPIIGLPVRGRPSPELENVMGFFNNMLPMRIPVDLSLSGLDWIRHVRQTLIQGYANQDVPFEMVAQELEVGKRGAPARMYHVMFTFQDVRQRPVQWGALHHSRIPLEIKGVTEDINLGIVDTLNGIHGDIRYDADIYLPETAANLRDRFVILLNRLVKAPEASLASLVGPTEADQAMARKLATPLAARVPHDLVDTIAAQISARPDAVGLIHGGVEVRYAELGRTIERAVAAFMKHGAVRRVGVCTADPLTQVCAALAAWKLGAECVFLDPLAPAEALVTAMQTSLVSHLLSDAATHATYPTLPWVDVSSIGNPAAASPPVRQADGRTALEAIDRRGISETIGALAADIGLQTTDAVLSVGSASRAHPILGGLLALAAGACWRVQADADPAKVLPLIRQNKIGIVFAGVGDWVSLLAAAGAAPLPSVAALDARDLPLALLSDLLKAGLRVYGGLHSDRSALALCGGWLADRRDATLCGRPLVGSLTESELVVLNASGQIAVPGFAGTLGLRSSTGQVQSLGVACRWRSDGVLQYLGELDPYEPVRLTPVDAKSATAHQSTADLGATERAVAEVWEALLGQPGITRADNFFELGGTSLLAMQAVAMLEQRLGKRISARRYVFDSLGQLGAAYDDAEALPQNDVPPPAASATQPAAPKGFMKRLAGLVGRN